MASSGVRPGSGGSGVRSGSQGSGVVSGVADTGIATLGEDVQVFLGGVLVESRVEGPWLFGSSTHVSETLSLFNVPIHLITAFESIDTETSSDEFVVLTDDIDGVENTAAHFIILEEDMDIETDSTANITIAEDVSTVLG